MLVNSSLSSSINVGTSFSSDFGQQHNRELLCDLSQCGETWQKYPHCDGQQHIFGESPHTTEDENRLSNGILQLSRTYSDPSVSSDASASSTPNLYGYVYTRRKRRRKNAVLSEENPEDGCKEDHAGDIGKSLVVHPLVVQKHDDKGDPPLTVDLKHSLDTANASKSGELDQQKALIPVPLITYTRKRFRHPSHNLPNKKSFVVALPAEESSGNRHKYAIKIKPDISRFSSSNFCTENGSVVTKNDNFVGKSSSPDAIGAETLKDCTLTREFCISVLINEESPVDLDTTYLHSADVLSVFTNTTQSCKACHLSENPLKMLICDQCEEAFHLSCCSPKVKKLPVDSWYCQPCLRKKKKALLKISCENRNKRLRGKANPISLMMKDDQPYKPSARIGKDFQAEVPDWAGLTISNAHDYFDNPLEDPTDFVNLVDWSTAKSSTDSFIGNWIQCREVLDDNQNNGETICGKWRRAPLYVVQTDDWDCSCALPWDAIHADCAVPQELETEVVLQHLKYIKMLRAKLANRR